MSVLGVGCGTLGAFWQGHSDADWRRALDTAISSGINLFDTADSYGRGRAEHLLGKALKGRGDDLVVITKTGLLKTPSSGMRVLAAAYRSAQGRVGDRLRQTYSATRRDLAQRRCATPEYVRRAAAASRKRLGRSQLDVFLLHNPPPTELRNSELIDTLHELRRSGKIRWWGVSARTTADAAVALEMPGIDCLEIEINVCNIDTTSGLIASAAEMGVAVIARQPFGSGALLRQIQEVAGGSDPRTMAASRDKGSILQVCLQYPLSLKGVSTVIAGMARPEHVVQNSQLVSSPPLPSGATESIRRQLCAGGQGAE